MIRTFKALGLALVAIFAMSAFMASAAHAVQGKFTPTASTKLTASQDDLLNGVKTTATGVQVFTTTSGSVECDEVTGKANVTANSEPTEITAEGITYATPQTHGGGGIITKADQCTGPFGTTPQIEFNECDYLFTAGETLGTSELTAQAHIKCPLIPGQQNHKQITITAPFCQIHVPEQSPGGHIIFHNVQNGTKTHITGEATVTGIVYQGTELCTSSTATNKGQYKGNITVKGFKAEPHNATQEEDIHVH